MGLCLYGTGIDKENSDVPFFVLNPESGKYESTAPELIERVGEAISPEDEINAAFAVIEQERQGLFEDDEVTVEAEQIPAEEGERQVETQEKIEFNPGDEMEVRLGSGESANAVVSEGDYGEGVIVEFTTADGSSFVRRVPSDVEKARCF